SPQKLLSNARLNFVSRSWIRKRGRWLRSSRSIRRLRACCVIQAVSGLLVQATLFDAARSDRDEERHLQPAQPDGVDGEEIAGEDGVARFAAGTLASRRRHGRDPPSERRPPRAGPRTGCRTRRRRAPRSAAARPEGP